MSGLTHLSLFTGIGGLDLAAEWAGFETVGQVEWAEYQTQVLTRHWPDVERWKDVRDFTIQSFRERTGLRAGEVTLLTGGPPCQPFSLAGNRGASDDERDMWPEYFRAVREVRPKWCVGENVRGLLTAEDGRYFRGILRQFADAGYSVAWGLIRACDAGAPHQRERVCLVAHAESELQNRPIVGSEAAGLRGFADSGALEHTCSAGQQEQHAAAVAGEAGHSAGRHYPGTVGDTNSRSEGDDLVQHGQAPRRKAPTWASRC